MILSCPACSTRYSVPDSAVGAKGRTVRCASCQHNWHVAGAAQPEAAPSAAAPKVDAAQEQVDRRQAERRRASPIAYRAKVEERQRKRAKMAAACGWGGVTACLAVGLALGWTFRADIVRALPQTAAAYAIAGADVNMYGLTIENLVSERVMDNGEPALSVRADLRNIDSKARETPLVRFDLRDAEGEAFFAWTVAPEAAALEPGQSIPVAAVLVNPPERATDVLMTLTTEPVGPDAERAAHEANLRSVLDQSGPVQGAAHGDAAHPEAAHHEGADAGTAHDAHG